MGERFEAVVEAVLPNGRFRLRLDDGREMAAYLRGPMRTNLVRLIPGDRVTAEVGERDRGRAHIVGKAGARR